MAAVDKATICNLALAHIKQTQTPIANLDTDTGNTAIQCRTHYDIARRFVLADHNWNFATKRLALADVGSPPALWTYRYDYPSDCLRFREIQRLAKTDVPVPYLIEGDGAEPIAGLSLLTDMAAAVGVWTWDVETVALFSSGFVSAFAWYLASELAPAMSGSEKLQQAALTVYTNTMKGSQAVDSAEGEADEDLNSPWERARI